MMGLSCKLLHLLAAVLFAICDGIHVSAMPRSSPMEGLEPTHLDTRSNESTDAREMEVEGHTVSKVSERWTGKVVFASVTTHIPAYREKLLTQLDTWAARPTAEGRYVAVGGKDYPPDWQTDTVLKSECGDDKQFLSCKEATVITEGAARGADWLVVAGEDNYIHTRHFEEALAKLDPNEVVAYGAIGCGKGMYCSEDPNMKEKGGFCGGATYAISRAAMQRLLANGAPALHKKYDPHWWPNDVTTSCELWKHGADLRFLDGVNGAPIFNIKHYIAYAKSQFLSVHYLEPAAVRWMHGWIENAPADVMRELRNKAFEHGCARGMNKSYWLGDLATCRADNPPGSEFY